MIEDKTCVISFAFLAAFSLSVSAIHVQNLSELSPNNKKCLMSANLWVKPPIGGTLRRGRAGSRTIVYSVTMIESFKPRPVSWSTS